MLRPGVGGGRGSAHYLSVQIRIALTIYKCKTFIYVFYFSTYWLNYHILIRQAAWRGGAGSAPCLSAQISIVVTVYHCEGFICFSFFFLMSSIKLSHIHYTDGVLGPMRESARCLSAEIRIVLTIYNCEGFICFFQFLFLLSSIKLAHSD